MMSDGPFSGTQESHKRHASFLLFLFPELVVAIDLIVKRSSSDRLLTIGNEEYGDEPGTFDDLIHDRQGGFQVSLLFIRLFLEVSHDAAGDSGVGLGSPLLQGKASGVQLVIIGPNADGI